MANHTSPAAMITTIEMTMLRRLPKPRRAGGCTAGAGAVSGTLVVLTLPSSPKTHLYDEPPVSRVKAPPSSIESPHPKPLSRRMLTLSLIHISEPRDGLLSIRRQRQMCIRDRPKTHLYDEPPVSRVKAPPSSIESPHPKPLSRRMLT